MNTLRAITIAATSVLALGISTGAAFAQETDPQIVVVGYEKACGTVTLKLTNNDVDDYGFTWATGPYNGGPLGATGLIVAPEGKTTTKTIHLPEDSFDGKGFLTLGVTYGPNTHKQKFLDLGLVDTDCAPPVVPPVTEEPEPTTPPTTTPAPTPTTNNPPPGTTTQNPPPPAVTPPPVVVNNNTHVNNPPAARQAPAPVNNSTDVPRGGVATGDGSSL